MRLYFAHPVNVYDTPLERAVMQLIAHTFLNVMDVMIENPNQPHHQIGYMAYAKRTQENKTAHNLHGGINYYDDKVLPLCNGVIAMPFLDNKFGSGVAHEVNWFLERSLLAYFLQAPTHIIWTDFEDFTHNPLNGFFQIKRFFFKKAQPMRANDPEIVMPRLETRLRTWVTYNRVMRDYESAHLVSMPLPDDFYPAQ